MFLVQYTNKFARILIYSSGENTGPRESLVFCKLVCFALGMFASPSSSSSSETPQLNAVEAAARAHAIRSRKGRRKIDSDEEAIRRALEGHGTESVLDHAPSPTKRDTSRYIGKLVAAAQVRKDDAERLAERRILLQRQEQDATFPEKPRFISKSYRASLQQRANAARETETKAKANPNLYTSKSNDNPSLVTPAASDKLDVPHASLLRFVSANMPKITGSTDALHFNDEQQSSVYNLAEAEKVESSSQKPNSQENQISEAANNSDQELKIAIDKSAIVTLKTSKSPRRSRFSSVQSSATEPAPIKRTSTPQNPPKKRGMRRNDEQAIEAYRQRYFERRAALQMTTKTPLDHAHTQPTPTLQ